MRGVKSARWVAKVAGAAVVALAATACGGGDGKNGGAGESGDTFRLGLTEPVAIDPFNVQESEGGLVARNLFTGLYGVEVDGEIYARLATAAKTSEDGTEWTFTLKKGTEFSNGEPVDAASFIRGWTRVVAKASASDVAYHMSGIEGYEDLNSGRSEKFAGLSAPDAYTLKVKLSAPDFEFDKKTVHTAFSPVPKVAGAGDNKTFNEAPVGNGPFTMEGKWEHDKSITLVRNNNYGFTRAKLARVEISLLNPANSIALEYKGYQTGQFDWARLPTPQLTAAKARYGPQGQWIRQDTSGINYLLTIDFNGPMKSADARKAVSYALDRQAITKSVFQGMQEPATALLPPSFTSAYTDGVCTSCVRQDKAKARQYARKAGLRPGTALKFGYNTGAGHEEWAQAVAQQLKDVLGLKVELEGKPWKEDLAAQQQKDATGIWRAAWAADFPSPDNFLGSLLSTDAINEDADGKALGNNRSRYSNPEFDALLKKARGTADDTERAQLYRQAEKLALDTDQALIPLFKRTQPRLANTKEFTHVKMDFFEDPTLAEISPE